MEFWRSLRAGLSRFASRHSSVSRPSRLQSLSLVAPKAEKPKAASSRKREWPDTDPPDKTDPYWKINNNLNVNGTPYRKEEIEPGRWQWVVDQKTLNYQQEREQSRRDLFWALRSRVLTDEEMASVTRYGKYLNIDNMVPYREADKAAELNDALLQQFKLRAIAMEAAKPTRRRRAARPKATARAS